jgi:hypothetical protein
MRGRLARFDSWDVGVGDAGRAFLMAGDMILFPPTLTLLDRRSDNAGANARGRAQQ